MPTILDLANVDYPEKFEGRNITATEGKSMLPVITGASEENVNDVLFWEHFGSRALRKGDWKAVKLDGNSNWELYNLAEDRTELNDLAATNPEKLEELKAEWDKLAKKTDVFPMP